MSLHYSNSSNNKMLSIKVLLISTSVLSMAMMLKLSMPVSDLPSIWEFLNSWLRPPYLYLIINCIIITIVASSRLQSKADNFDHHHHPLLPPETAILLQTEPVKMIPRADVPMDYAAAVYDSVIQKSEPVEVKPEFENDYVAGVQVPEPDLYGAEDVRNVEIAVEEIKSVNEIILSKPGSSIPKKEFTIPRKKPPVSARLGHRKSSTEGGGRTLGVAKPKRHDTLESTWRTITEGRPMPLTRHLKKSDTWETQGRDHHTPTTTTSDQMTKSEMFNVSNPPPTSLSRSTGSGKLKKDPSLGQEELNRKVEAFIKKFNEDMKLQKQESLNQYMEMINRGAHQD